MDKRPFPAYDGPDKQVFVCYSHADAATVLPEITALHERGVNIWYDEGIEVGGEWRAEIAEALDKAVSVLFYQSEASSGSRHCVREISYALSREIPVIRIDLDGSELPPGLRLGLEIEQAIDRRQYSKADYTAKLLRALRSSTEHSVARPMPTLERQQARWWLYSAAVLVTTAIIGGFWWTHQETPALDEAAASRESPLAAIAVLPFEDVSPDGDQAYLGIGIADELRLELQRLDGLRVAGRTSSNAYLQEDGKTIGEILAVDFILEGSVRKEENRIRITVQLTNAANGFTIWSESYNRELDKLFEMQEEIATSVAGSLGVSLGVGSVNAFPGAGTNNIEAYETYLKAYSEAWSEADTRESISLLERAIELDPSYAVAWSHLANLELVEMWDADDDEIPDILERAHQLARRGAELDAEASGVQSVLALIQMIRFDWIGSEQGHTRAIDSLADRPTVARYALLLLRAGRILEAQEQIHRARRLEPLGGRPPAFAWHASLSQGRISEAQERSDWQSGIDVIENNLDIAFNKRDPEALKAAIRAIPEATRSRGSADERIVFLNRSYLNLYSSLLAEFESPERVLTILRDVYLDEDSQWPRKLHDIALAAAYFGDPEFALKAKSQEIRVRPVRMPALWYPIMSKVRQLPAFKALVTELSLIEYWRAYGWADACRPLGDDDFECS